ncbi:MAG: hypothetical protein ACWA5A_09885 [Marinibacterium sp.]
MGQAIAFARAMPSAAGPASRVEICSGSGPVMIFMDADGQPVAPPHFCPDGAMALFHGFFLAAPDPAQPTARPIARASLADWRAPDISGPTASARSPPLP